MSCCAYGLVIEGPPGPVIPTADHDPDGCQPAVPARSLASAVAASRHRREHRPDKESAVPIQTTLVTIGVSTVFLLPTLAFAALTDNGQCGATSTALPHQSAETEVASTAAGTTSTRWDTTQRQNAAAIVNTGMGLGVPPRGWVIAVAVAIQESSLHNVNYGDQAGPDSRGLFQQRAAWGPLPTRMNAQGAATLFFTGGLQGQPGLLDISGWQQMPLTKAANLVQRSAHPEDYAKHEPDAVALVTAAAATIDPSDLSAGLRACLPPCAEPDEEPDGCADASAVFVRAQTWLTAWSGGPVPYRASANPGDLFDGYRRDCSGFVSMALGLPGPGLNTSGLAAASTRIEKTDLQPGDLLINTAPNLRGHVVLFERWSDASMTSYYGYEQSGDGGTHHRRIPYPYYGTYPMTLYRFQSPS